MYYGHIWPQPQKAPPVYDPLTAGNNIRPLAPPPPQWNYAGALHHHQQPIPYSPNPTSNYHDYQYNSIQSSLRVDEFTPHSDGYTDQLVATASYALDGAATSADPSYPYTGEEFSTVEVGVAVDGVYYYGGEDPRTIAAKEAIRQYGVHPFGYASAGKDVVACLKEAMQRQGLNMWVSALVNDAVATLAGAKYWDDDVLIAVILGTGTNACYIERKDAIPKLQWSAGGTGNMLSPVHIISTEWGAFTTDLPLTEFDKDLDSESINPGEQIFEKTISGMYLGEIVRRVILKMASVSSLFGDSIPEKLLIPLGLRTPDLCAMQQDDTKDLSKVEEILSNTIGATRSTLKARKIVVDVCDTIVKRGGRLAGAGIVGILQKMEQDSKGLISGKRTVVAMDGGLYEHYPQYRNYLKEAVAELLGAEVSKNIVIEHTKDGSGIGAALLAAANSKYASEF